MSVDKEAYEGRHLVLLIALCLCLCVLFPQKWYRTSLPLVWQTCFLDSTIYLGDLFVIVHTDDLSHFFSTSYLVSSLMLA